MERRYKDQDMPESVRYLKSLPRDKRKVRAAMFKENMTDVQRLEFRGKATRVCRLYLMHFMLLMM